MTNQHTVEFILLAIYILFLGYLIYKEEVIIKFERRVIKKVMIYARALLWATEAYMAERRNIKMFVIFKTPGRESERRHNVANNLKAVYREIDSENPGSVDIGMGIKMFYDTDAFAKMEAPGITDERAEKMYYGDTVFVAFDSENKPRGLTEREVKFVNNYISTYRADKLVS